MKTYKLTKSIRFKLNIEDAPTIQSEVKSLHVDEPSNRLSSLVKAGYDLALLVENYIFTDKQKKKLKATVTVHFRWLRQFTRNEFYDWIGNKKVNKKIILADVPYLPEYFTSFVNEWRYTLDSINNTINLPKEVNTRKANIGLDIKRIGARKMLPFIESFVKDSNDRNTDEIKQNLQEVIQNIKNLQKVCEQWCLPAQSSGVEIARASFNYYTINKKPKDFNIEKKDIEKQLAGKFIFSTSQKQLLQKIGLSEFLEKPIAELYNDLKEYKSTQKKQLEESVKQGYQYDAIEKKHLLFAGDSNAFKKYAKLTIAISNHVKQRENTTKQSHRFQQLSEEITKLKIQRGKLFFDGRSKSGEPNERFKTYLNFCKIFKDIAQKRGRLIARLKGIEKEVIDSQRLQYWAIMLEKNKRHQIALIPNKFSQNAYKQLNQWQNSDIDGANIYYFESLTYRSLKKLCFGINGNTFLPEVKKELKEKELWKYHDRDFGEHTFKNEDDSRDEQALIAFYKTVLQTNYVKQNIKLPASFDEEIIKKEFSSEQAFRIALEKCCYLKYKKAAYEQLQYFLKENQAEVLTITTYDLERLDRLNETNCKAHTQLWLNFWKEENQLNRFPIRLNPEITITWREHKESRIKKYGPGTPLYNPNRQNRYLHPQLTLVTTFSNNSLSPEINYAFQDAQQKGAAIIGFNKDIHEYLQSKSKNQHLWVYGIDTGKVELATLCLINQKNELQNFNILELNKEKFNYEKTGYLKDGTEKSYKAIQNLSYFLNPKLYEQTFKDRKFNETFDELFTKRELPAIDLSAAKVINGHLVLNGDIVTYKKLREVNEQRKNKQSVSSVEKINHIRNALVANMIGVLYHLYKTYPGLIVLEDNPQSWIEDERLKFEGRLERPLEWAIYKKFQNDGLTPPISELVRLREVEKFEIDTGKQKKFEHIKQFGVLLLVNKEGTSLQCPQCNKNAYENENELMADKSQKVFSCKHCGYHNTNNPNNFVGLDNNDKVAAYNIAKRGFEKLFPKKQFK